LPDPHESVKTPGLFRAAPFFFVRARNSGRIAAFKRLFMGRADTPLNSTPILKGLFSMRGKLTALGVTGALVLAGLSLSLLGTEATQAASPAQATFIVPANDGYGIADCASCGKVVADSWCEAQGFARSESFGLADAADVTGSIATQKVDRPISITCAE
jgi:hypothetical protein